MRQASSFDGIFCILHYLVCNPIMDETVLYNDNRISLYCAQMGRCAVTSEKLEIGTIHCHHKTPRKNGGTDAYENLLIVSDTVHRLIHATDPMKIRKYMEELKLTEKQMKKVDKYRRLAGVESCSAVR